MDPSPTFNGRWFVIGVLVVAVMMMTLVVVFRDRIRPPVRPVVEPPTTLPTEVSAELAG